MALAPHKTVNIETDPENPPLVSTTGASGTPAAKKTTSFFSGLKSSNGNNSVIAAPGSGISLVLVSVLLQNTTANATTMLLQDDTGGTEIIGCLGQNQGDGLTMTWPADARPKLTANKPLNLNLSGANACRISVVYYTE